MTQKRILELAYETALDAWYKHKIRADEFPDNIFIKPKLEKAEKELDEISQLLYG